MSQGILLGGSGGYGTLPEQVSGFYAARGNAQVALTWSNPSADYAGTLIVRKTGNYPQRPSDGAKIYRGTATSCTDTGLTNDTQYYYRAFSYNSRGEYQTISRTATAKPIAGTVVSTMPVGTKIKLGMYYEQPIIWKIIDKNHSGYPANSVTLMADKILALRCFDAAEPTNPDSNRREYGDNRYSFSNIRQWLNSEANAGKWYSAKHQYDAPPSNANVRNGYNGYDTQAGFLNHFSASAKSLLLNTTLTTTLSSADGGGSETVMDKIFLASRTEMNLGNNIADGVPFAIFDSDASRGAQITAECIRHDPSSYNLDTSRLWYYWLRTPADYKSYLSHYVSNSGALDANDDGQYTYVVDWGIRPLCNVFGYTPFSIEPDSDGCYTVLE
ncbi:MAG: fibronectin type III domain-containing protein [Oscillospiraceae bacterium]|jgi:hypothetical protein|nr:fibronectin type III domain-containing protein [Oscillospiraceae bacterium]